MSAPRIYPATNLVFLNRVYPPAEGATGELLQELAIALANDNWPVTIVTSRPSVGPSSPSDPPRSEPGSPERQSVRVERVRGLPFTRANHLKRALSYVSLYPALFWRAVRVSPGRGGTIVTLTDPPLLLVLGPILKWVKKCRLIHWAQDIYPEVAEELGVVRKGGWLAGLLRMLSTWALRRHDLIIVVGRCMKQRLVQRGIAPEKIVIVANWAQAGPPGAAREKSLACSGEGFRTRHGFFDRFVVMYSGNFGLAHPFEAIVAVIADLEKTAPQILFVFIGSGPRLTWLKEELKDRIHVRFLPFQPKENLRESLASADLHLASMSENLCGLVVPSKVYGILAAGRPCVFIGPKESEAAQILREFDCGTVIGGTDHAGLTSAIRKFASDPNRLNQARRNTGNAMKTNNFANALSAFKAAVKLAEKTTDSNSLSR